MEDKIIYSFESEPLVLANAIKTVYKTIISPFNCNADYGLRCKNCPIKPLHDHMMAIKQSLIDKHDSQRLRDILYSNDY